MNKNNTYSDNKVDQALLKRVSRRAAEYKSVKKDRNSSNPSDSESLDALIESVSTVFEVPEKESERITQQVLIEKYRNRSIKDTLVQEIATHLKEYKLLLLVVTIISLSIFAFAQTREKLEKKGQLEIPMYIQKQISQDQLKSEFASIFTTLYQIQSMQLDYRNKNGRYSSSLLDLKMSEEQIDQDNNIKKITLSKNGRIRVQLEKKFGENVFVLFKPIDSVVENHVYFDEFKGRKIPKILREDVIRERNIAYRKTKWKCNTNFSIKVGWCKTI